MKNPIVGIGVTSTPARALRRLTACIALHAFASMGFAAAPDLGEAQRLLDAGQAEASAALLERDLLSFAGNADYDYLLGLAWYRAGQTGPALFAFERVAMSDPGNIDARLKAAQINLERGGAAYADELLAPLSTLRPSADQQQEIERLHAQIAAAKASEKLSLRGYVQTGIGWDDNITGGPDRATLLIPSLGTTALGTAARDHDRLIQSEAGLALRATLDDDTWLTGVGSIRQGDNWRRKDVKEGVVNLDLGLLRRSGDDFFGAAMLAQRYLLGSTLYRSSLGGRLNWIHPVSTQARITGYVQHIELDFPDHPIDNAGRSIAGLTRDTATADGASAWQYGIYGGTEKANDATKTAFTYHLLGMHLGNTLTLSDDLAISAAAMVETHRHVALDGMYPAIMRRDTRSSLGVAADYKLGGRWHLLPRYTYTNNASNIELYQYARNTFTLQLRWDFDNARN